MPVRIQRILTETVNLMSGKQQIVVCLAVMADVKQSLMNAVSSRVADFPRRPVRPRPGRELALRQTAQTFRPVVFHRCPFFRRQENHRTVRRLRIRTDSTPPVGILRLYETIRRI